jgi:hypothetical protein
MANKATFKVVVKDGDTDYNYDSKTQKYESKKVDYIYETDSLADALREFCDYASNEYNEEKVSLILLPAKNKKK